MLSVLSAQFESRFFVDVRMVPLNGSAIFIHIGLNLRFTRKNRKSASFYIASDNELWDRTFWAVLHQVLPERPINKDGGKENKGAFLGDRW